MNTQVSNPSPNTPIPIKSNGFSPDQGLSARYVWKTGKPLFLSKRQSIVADTYLETRNISICLQKLKGEMGKAPSYSTVRRMLEIPIVKDYLAEQLEERGVYAGWTEAHWFKTMSDHLTGVKRLANGDLYAMKLIAEYKGWGDKSVMQFNQSINIVQADGRA